MRYAEIERALASGYIYIENPGTYWFKTYVESERNDPEFDRNTLYINGKLVCQYRGSFPGGSDLTGNEKITLPKGMASIACIGYVDSKGIVEVLWRPEKQGEYSPIPKDLLFYEPSAEKTK